MPEVVRWGVLGNALIARVCVVPAIVKSRNGVLHGVGSRSLERANELAEANSGANIYKGYEALLADPDIDAVYIPLPNHLHLPWTLKALAAGKHVLCEKPLALNAVEAQQMVDAAQAAHLHLMEAFMYRFHPRSQRIREMVQSGQLGSIQLIRSAFTFNIADKNNIRFDPAMGGGALMDVGCYGVSVARWLLNEEPEAVQAQAVYSDTGVDINLVGSLRFSSGPLAVIEASFTSALQQTFSVIGDQAAIDLPHDAFIPWEKEAVFTLRGPEDEVGEQITTPGADEYQLMVEHFADAVLGTSQLGFFPTDSIANMRVLDALAEAAEGRETVNIVR